MNLKKIVVKAKGGIMMETLRDNDLDLRKFGEVSVRRSSEIQFDEANQKFFIEFLEPQLKERNPEFRTKFFDTYELAVCKEVEVINEARKSGVL
jgi:hypothetical protein